MLKSMLEFRVYAKNSTFSMVQLTYFNGKDASAVGLIDETISTEKIGGWSSTSSIIELSEYK